MSALAASPSGTQPGRARAIAARLRWPVLWLLVLYAVLSLIGELAPAPSGPRSSSYATSGPGLAAYADLLRRQGRRVEEVRRNPDTAPLDPATTVVMLDPADLIGREVRALRRFVAAGGRLVAGGRDPGRWLGELAGEPPAWSPHGARSTSALTSGLPGVRRVLSAGEGGWERTGPGRALVGGPEGALVVDQRVGRGTIILLADPSPLQNRLLGQADNAALGVALTGEGNRPVAFLETVHGYGSARGIAALPSHWLWALGGLLLAVLLWLASHVRRLGPVELEARDLPPPRYAYVDAVATLLERTRRPAEASVPVARAARTLLLRRAALPPDAGDEQLTRAAERFGLGEDEARAVVAGPRTEEDALAAGRALAHLQGGRR